MILKRATRAKEDGVKGVESLVLPYYVVRGVVHFQWLGSHRPGNGPAQMVK